ncbi:MAG TPA: cytochrome C oxidase subunit IV family protein [Candidatus Acidoferrales bacterium]|nr:cytochrome C oxidase subunit IV family protein [Candidatus Acidoferrales bacterium]
MSEHAEATHTAEHAGSTRLFLVVWISLVVITMVEVFIAYKNVGTVAMLLMLIGLSVLKAGLIVAYFMHMRFEKFGLFLTLVPATIFCIGMMTVIFPDSMRLFHIRMMH